MVQLAVRPDSFATTYAKGLPLLEQVPKRSQGRERREPRKHLSLTTLFRI